MPLPALKFFKTPPPKVVLLPGSQFFVRAVPVAEGATAADVAMQVELALESLAPFPLAQMYHGYCWLPGAKHALAYAAYRKRFSAESTEQWAEADAVLPDFAAVFTAKAKPGTACILSSEDCLTVIHWTDTSGVPSMVLSRILAIAPEGSSATEQEKARATVREDLLRACGTINHHYDVALSSDFVPVRDDDTLVFRIGSQEARFNREELDALDVRDKEDLAARRQARRRDLILWRSFLGCAAALGLCALLELLMIAGKVYQKVRLTQVEIQSPIVAEIDRANSLATRIEDLSTKRLLPFEMIDIAKEKMPSSILYTRVITRGLYTIEVTGKTNIATDFGVYRSLLSDLPQVEKVEVQNQAIRDGLTNFSLSIAFKPGTVKPAAEELPAPADAAKAVAPVPMVSPAKPATLPAPATPTSAVAPPMAAAWDRPTETLTPNVAPVPAQQPPPMSKAEDGATTEQVVILPSPEQPEPGGGVLPATAYPDSNSTTPLPATEVPAP